MNPYRGYPGKRKDYSPKLLRGLWINVQGSGKWTWVSLCFRGCSWWSQSCKGANSDLPRGQEQSHGLPGLSTQEHSQFDGSVAEAAAMTLLEAQDPACSNHLHKVGHGSPSSPGTHTHSPPWCHCSGWGCDIPAIPAQEAFLQGWRCECAGCRGSNETSPLVWADLCWRDRTGSSWAPGAECVWFCWSYKRENSVMEPPLAEVPMEMLTTLAGSCLKPCETPKHSFHQGQGRVLHHSHLSHTDIFSSQTTQDMGFECSNTTFFKLATSVEIGWLTAL